MKQVLILICAVTVGYFLGRALNKGVYGGKWTLINDKGAVVAQGSKTDVIKGVMKEKAKEEFVEARNKAAVSAAKALFNMQNK